MTSDVGNTSINKALPHREYDVLRAGRRCAILAGGRLAQLVRARPLQG